MTQVLVVNDNEDFAGAIRMVLHPRGFDVPMEHDTDGRSSGSSSGSPTR